MSGPRGQFTALVSCFLSTLILLDILLSLGPVNSDGAGDVL